jgi:PQQ-dependent catabolism-associated CXXCW motif protein
MKWELNARTNDDDHNLHNERMTATRGYWQTAFQLLSTWCSAERRQIRKAIPYALSLMAAVGLAGPIHASTITTVNFNCNIEGAPARLTAQVEAVNPAAVFMDPNSGKFGGVVSPGETNYYYGGTLVSATARYSFTGTNGYADFVDLIRNERFRVQMILRGQQLLMVVNPQGPGPVQYLCQQSNGGAPQFGGVPQQPQGGGGAPQQPGRGADLDQMMTIERADLGVPATRQLHNGEMHGPTPNSIPGGQVVTTKGLVELVQKHPVPFVLIDALGGAEMLPEAVPAAWASKPGSFSDQTQQQLVQLLQQQTKGNKGEVLVFYCLSRECWMSYNAALRAINAGYTNVLWYRGGIQAWKQAGLPTAQSLARGFYPAQPQLQFGR